MTAALRPNVADALFACCSVVAKRTSESLASLRAYRARSAHFGQPFCGLSHHVYSPLQFLLQFRDVHLVRDAISVADALHIAVLMPIAYWLIATL